MDIEHPTGVTQLEIDQRIFDLYDEYCHGDIDRRAFLARAAIVTAGGLPWRRRCCRVMCRRR